MKASKAIKPPLVKPANYDECMRWLRSQTSPKRKAHCQRVLVKARAVLKAKRDALKQGLPQIDLPSL